MSTTISLAELKSFYGDYIPGKVKALKATQKGFVHVVNPTYKTPKARMSPKQWHKAMRALRLKLTPLQPRKNKRVILEREPLGLCISGCGRFVLAGYECRKCKKKRLRGGLKIIKRLEKQRAKAVVG